MDSSGPGRSMKAPPRGRGRVAGSHTHEDMGRSVKPSAVSQKDIDDFLAKGGEIKKIKSKGIPTWAKKQHQKSGPASAHRIYKPGSGKSEKFIPYEVDEGSIKAGTEKKKDKPKDDKPYNQYWREKNPELARHRLVDPKTGRDR